MATWTDLPGHAHFTDDGGWGAAQHYETLKFAAVAKRLYYVGRGVEEVKIASFDPATNGDPPGSHTHFLPHPEPGGSWPGRGTNSHVKLARGALPCRQTSAH